MYEAKTMTVTEIGRVLGVSRSTIYRALWVKLCFSTAELNGSSGFRVR
ncbi:MAG: helix-turn-helix domain-containing protein [Brevibacterium aurantiacum]